MEKRGLSFFMLVVILSLISVNALISNEDDNIKTSYNAGEIISGTINVSIEDVDALGRITSNFPGNITLIEFLESSDLVNGIDFNCSTGKCVEQYTTLNEIESVSLAGEKTIGLRISKGSDIFIESISFNISNNLPESCGQSPIFIDILGDGESIISSNSYKDEICGSIGRNYGCFDKGLNSGEYTEAILSDSNLCENVSVVSGPAYRVGAKIKNKTGGAKGDFLIELLDFEGGFLGDCSLPDLSQDEEDLECLVEYSSVKSESFLVCVRNQNYDGISDYTIRSETKSPECGTSGRDLEIFARPVKYDSVNMIVNAERFNIFEINLEDYVNNYLEETYGLSQSGVNCDKECVIPVKLSGPSQQIQLKDIEVRYKAGIVPLFSRKFYTLSSEKPKITASNIEIDLKNAGFTIPLGSDAEKFELKIDGKVFFTEKISISESFDFDLKQKFVLFGIATEFEVDTDENINKSTWDFGDGTINVRTGKKIRHRYTSEGEFEFEVKLVSDKGVMATKKFKVQVGNPKEAANQTLDKYEKRINSLSNELNSFDFWVKKEIESILQLNKTNSSLSALRIKFLKDKTNEDYLDTMNKLLVLNVPSSISIVKKGQLPMAVGLEDIDLSYIEKISEEEIENTGEARGRINSWIFNNYNPQVSFDLVSLITDDGEEELISKFKISLNSKQEKEVREYLIIDFPLESINFLKNYGQKKINGGTYIALDKEKQIEFSIKEHISVESLRAYISPSVEELQLTVKITEEEEPEFNKKRFIIWTVILFFGFLVVYIILQEWYKWNYESTLFENKNDLYNLINFIYNARVGNLGNAGIRKKLRERGWKREQINYALKKIDGKRTGMFEIPILKMFENRKVRREIEKRQGRRADVRYLKQPRLYRR